MCVLRTQEHPLLRSSGTQWKKFFPNPEQILIDKFPQ